MKVNTIVKTRILNFKTNSGSTCNTEVCLRILSLRIQEEAKFNFKKQYVNINDD